MQIADLKGKSAVKRATPTTNEERVAKKNDLQILESGRRNEAVPWLHEIDGRQHVVSSAGRNMVVIWAAGKLSHVLICLKIP